MKTKTSMGEHWKDTGFSALYQLCRRVETVADQLRKRQKDGQAPLVSHVQELDAIAGELRSLDRKSP
jgi:hypothetical protein